MYAFIVNQTAGHGRGKRVFKKIQRSKIYQQLPSSLYFTESAGHAEEIAKQIVEQRLESLKAIIIIGGDGTLHEVINGMGDQLVPVVFIPGGSGNDFSRGISMIRNPIKILENVVNNPQTIPYWLGEYKVDTETRKFVNNIGFGFDAQIAEKANGSWYKRLLNLFYLGSLSYAIALIHVLFHFKPFTLELEIDGNKQIVEKCWMVTISNHAYYGGGMKIIPSATIKPLTFPILLVHNISKWKVLGLFITVFKGSHVHFKEVDVLEASWIKITTKKSIHFQFDGQTGLCNSCIIEKKATNLQIMGTNK